MDRPNIRTFLKNLVLLCVQKDTSAHVFNGLFSWRRQATTSCKREFSLRNFQQTPTQLSRQVLTHLNEQFVPVYFCLVGSVRAFELVRARITQFGLYTSFRQKDAVQNEIFQSNSAECLVWKAAFLRFLAQILLAKDKSDTNDGLVEKSATTHEDYTAATTANP